MTVHLIDRTIPDNNFLEVKMYAKHKAHLPPLDTKYPNDVALLVSDVQVSPQYGLFDRNNSFCRSK
jgi:hypothetical protein